MPKHGYASLTLKREVAELLRVRARALKMGLNDFLELILCLDRTPTTTTLKGEAPYRNTMRGIVLVR